MKKPALFLVIFAAFVAMVSCKKDTKPPVPKNGTLTINIGYNFDGTVLKKDTLLYINAADYKMSVSTLNYYISGLTFYKSDGSPFTLNDVHYVSFANSATNQLSCTLPYGDYTSMKFYIGLDSIHNQTGSLPATPENNNMIWPDAMGGGYHFLKMEGYYLDKGGRFGYAVHLGKNKYLVQTRPINKSASVNGNPATLDISMNVAEWFKNPAVYDFNIDGNFTMSNDKAMAKIAANGVDVF